MYNRGGFKKNLSQSISGITYLSFKFFYGMKTTYFMVNGMFHCTTQQHCLHDKIQYFHTKIVLSFERDFTEIIIAQIYY